jgi:F0F1-type ATP synthase assembly protein I
MATKSNGSRLARTARQFQANVSRAGTAASVSYGLIGGIILFGGLGYLADGWLETSPWLLLLGLMLGIVVGFYELAKTIWRR